MMMMMMMIQQQQQMEEQRRQQAAAAFANSQRAENQNYQRYQDQISTQNKKVGDQWDLYNANMDKILKLNPQYNAQQKYTFNPYQINPNYRKSTDQASADQNTDDLNKWYSNLDKQSLDDYNQAKSQYDASKNWLTDAQSAADAAARGLPGIAPGIYAGDGGDNVSGRAGGDTLAGGTGSKNVGGTSDGIYNIAGGNPAASGAGGLAGSAVGMEGGGTGSGMVASDPSKQLAGMFSNAVAAPKSQSSMGYMF
jgi:hypothetical protein